MIDVSPSDPFGSNASELFAGLQSEKPDAVTLNFVRAINVPKGCAFENVASLKGHWDSFTTHQQQLLFPVLEQGSLPDEITKPGPQHLDWPEPNIRFAGLGEFPFLNAADEPSNSAPDKIVLTISLNYSYTYVYPQVYVQQEVSKPNAWMGMYYTQR